MGGKNLRGKRLESRIKVLKGEILRGRIKKERGNGLEKRGPTG